jgi:glycosyltransferase involved in cell wall biosynthesis
VTTAPVALVVCTRNRAEKLQPFLRSLALLDGPGGSEIVIVDNGSTDDTQRRLQEFVPPPGFSFRIVVEGTPGLGRARNAGWSASSAPIVVFTDDDCYVSASLLRDYAALYSERPEVGCIGGSVSLYDPADLRMTVLERKHEVLLAPRSFVRTGFVLGANLSFRREVLSTLGGFDVDFGAGTPFPAEDVDMVANAVASGWHALYHPLPNVRHHHGRRSRDDAAALKRSYDAGRGAYYVKYLLDSRVRTVYLGAWIRKALTSPLGRSWREATAGLAYARSRSRGGRRTR